MHGWEDKGLGNGEPSILQESIDLDYYNSVDELAELGPERLKQVADLPFHLEFYHYAGCLSCYSKSLNRLLTCIYNYFISSSQKTILYQMRVYGS